MMTKQQSNSRVQINIDLSKRGRQIGDIKLKWSDNRQPLGYYPVPIICLSNGSGPTILLTGGVHGDEFEGPVALMRLVQKLSLDDIHGRVIILPALNAAAVQASSRVSPVDLLNLNRAFPGDADGSPTQMMAHFVETVLLPECDVVIDLHTGGKASIFAPCVLAQVDSNTSLGKANLALAKAFATPYLWVAGIKNDNRSLSAAAARQQISMIAAELGGGGGCDPSMANFTETAVMRCLSHLGIVAGSDDQYCSKMECINLTEAWVSPAVGLLDRHFHIGDKVVVGQFAGWLHFVNEPERPSLELKFNTSGIILAHSNRGMVERGDLIANIATSCSVEGIN
jgi:predicted deacylase|tara:strand:- start:1458 stop:2477 length:1020 start_codon:yes stop_codon:yes gene_type:complete